MVVLKIIVDKLKKKTFSEFSKQIASWKKGYGKT